MSQLLVIFRKDARRLWPGVLLGLLLLAILTAIDNARADYIPSLEESLCNVLLPLVWCGLIIQLIHQEAPAHANPFYATRPYCWPLLIAAKLCFVLLFIHVPLLIANSVVLSAHGFAPWQHLPALLSLQLTVAAILTLPSLALASVTRTLGQAAWTAMLLIVAGTMLRRNAWPVQLPWVAIDTDSLVASLACLTLAAVLLLSLQFARRRTALSRTIGVAALLLAATIFVYLPHELTAALRASASSATRLELRPADSTEFKPSQYGRRGVRTLSVPVKLSGARADTQVATEILKLNLSSGQGFHWEFNRHETPNPLPKPVQAGIWIREDGMGYLALGMLQPTFETLKRARLNMQGKLSVYEYEKSPQSRMPVHHPSADAAGFGRCSSLLTDNPLDADGSEMLKVLCESPEPLPDRVDVLLSSQVSAEPWRHFLGDADAYASYPRITWLSPLHRKQTFFHVSPRAGSFPGSRYLVPKTALQDGVLTFQPWRKSRGLVVPFSFSNLSLKEGLVQD